MVKIKEFLKTRTVGFYLVFVATVLSFVQAIVYVATYTGSSLEIYYVPAAFALPFVGIALCVGMLCFARTREWAPLVLFALELGSFLLFAKGTYLYLTEVFYAGVNAEAFKMLNKGFTASVVLYLLVIILSIVALFLRMSKSDKKSSRGMQTELDGGSVE